MVLWICGWKIDGGGSLFDAVVSWEWEKGFVEDEGIALLEVWVSLKGTGDLCSWLFGVWLSMLLTRSLPPLPLIRFL